MPAPLDDSGDRPSPHPVASAPTDAERPWVVYVDLDAFYVACELRDRPDLEGRPVIVGPDPTKAPTRGVVLSASYEARARGVTSAMPVQAAARRCPDAVWIPADFPKYARVSDEFRQVLARHPGTLVPWSIDEAALYVTGGSADDLDRLARDLQKEIRRDVRVPASIGVAPSRTVAKIATDRAKPGGVLVVPHGEVEAFLAPLPVRSIPGVGPKTEAILLAAGIERIGDLAEGVDAALRSRLGAWADGLVDLARGEPREAPPGPDSGPKSRSSDRTFATDVADPAVLEAAVHELALDLAESLEREGMRYRTVTVALRWSDFTRVQRSRSLASPVEGGSTLFTTAVRLVREVWDDARGHPRPVRLVSVRAERLEPKDGRQRRLDAYASTGGDRMVM